MSQRLGFVVLALTCFLPFLAGAEEESIEIFKPSYTIFQEFGSIRRGVEFGGASKQVFNDYWVQRTGGFVNFTARKNERLTLDLLIGGLYWNPTFNENSNPEGVLRYFAASAPRLNVSYVFGDIQTPFLKVDAGLLQYKYNDYSRNLGEYMFRTAAYPQLVYTGGLTFVDMNKAPVTGIKITHSLGKIFSQDLILHTETDQLPHYDLTLAYMAKINWRNAFKVSAGAKFARLIPIQPSVTNPDAEFNRYFTFNDTTYVDNSGYYDQHLKALRRYPGSVSAADSLGWERGKFLADTLRQIRIFDTTLNFSQALNTLAIAQGVTRPTSYSHYQATSITPAISFSVDPKPFLPLGIFGPKDLVLYGEAALLGIKDYPVLYEKKGERTIMMVGFNVPAFNLLEVFSVELEWFGSRFPNSNQETQRDVTKNLNGVFQFLNQPSIYNASLGDDGYSPEDWEKDDIKWSVLAQRRVLNGFSVAAQLASDNARGWVYPSGRRYWALFRKPSDWYWMLKLTANI